MNATEIRRGALDWLATQPAGWYTSGEIAAALGIDSAGALCSALDLSVRNGRLCRKSAAPGARATWALPGRPAMVLLPPEGAAELGEPEHAAVVGVRLLLASLQQRERELAEASATIERLRADLHAVAPLVEAMRQMRASA